MEMEYRRTWNQSFLIIRDVDIVEDYILKMLKWNQIDGLLDLQPIEENGKMHLSYDITGKKSLDSYLENRELGLKDIQKILKSLIHTCREMDRYLLPEEYLFLRQDVIFWDGNTGEWCFCYDPAEERDLKTGFRNLLEDLMPKWDHEKKEETEIFYRLYQNVQEENYSLLELQEIFFLKEEPIREKTEETEMQEEPKRILSEEIEKEAETGYAAFLKNSAYQVLEKGISMLHMDKLKERKKKSPPEAKTTYFLEEETPKKARENCAKLIYLGKGEEKDFLLDQPVFLLGREEALVDGLLHSAAVGSVQAKIYREDDIYYIEDMNSAHGTLVNGELLIYKSAKRLEEGDRITFADIAYRFLTFSYKSII